ncbi:hypothetical protein HPULCUR_000629 [Helicostylum pulchrum]|uniref:Ubiquitin-like domain-containing protein n=1 Tax=Helicostylum pulchrum TaxID=562976 RepID=A0ABP9XKH7_9FUNG
MDTRVIVLSIKSLEQQIKSVSLPRNASVLELKAKIQIKFDIEETRQRLIFQGKVLKDGKHLSDYDNLDDGKIIHLVVRPIGTPHNPNNDEPSRNTTRPTTTRQLSEGYAVITLDASMNDLPLGQSLMSSLMNNLLPPPSSPSQTRPTGLLHALRSLNGTSTSIRDFVRQERRNGLDGLLDIMSTRPSSITLPVPSSVEMRLSRTLSYIREIRSLLDTPITETDNNRPNQIRHSSIQAIRESRELLQSVGRNNHAAQVGLVLEELANLTTVLAPWLTNMAQSLRTDDNGRTSNQQLSHVLRTARIVQILSLIHHFLGSVLSTVETEGGVRTTYTTTRDTIPETWSSNNNRIPSSSSTSSSSSSSAPKRKQDDNDEQGSSSSKKVKE